MAIIRMRDHLYDEIVNYAKEHLPEEACGLLAGVETGEGREIRKVYFLENKDHAEDHFTLDPRDQINAIRDMRANGLKPLGNWHSHPSSPSRPSVEDIRLAFDSKASYLILSLMADYPVLNSFHIEGGEWTKEDLRIYSEEYYFLRFTDRITEAEMFEAGLFVETFLPLFILSAYKNSVHCKSIVILVNNSS